MNTTHNGLERFESLAKESLSLVYYLWKQNKQTSKTDVDGPWIMVNIEKEPSSSLTSSLSL